MTYRQQVSGVNYTFDGLVELMAKATPLRSGDQLAGCAAEHDAERAAAAWVLADLPLDTFLKEEIVPYETDEVTRLIFDSHDRQAFSAISHLTVGGFRDWLCRGSAAPTRIATASQTFIPPKVGAIGRQLASRQVWSPGRTNWGIRVWISRTRRERPRLGRSASSNSTARIEQINFDGPTAAWSPTAATGRAIHEGVGLQRRRQAQP